MYESGNELVTEEAPVYTKDEDAADEKDKMLGTNLFVDIKRMEIGLKKIFVLLMMLRILWK